MKFRGPAFPEPTENARRPLPMRPTHTEHKGTFLLIGVDGSNVKAEQISLCLGHKILQ